MGPEWSRDGGARLRFEAWLVDVADGVERPFEELLEEHPEEQDELRKLHRLWRSTDALLEQVVGQRAAHRRGSCQEGEPSRPDGGRRSSGGASALEIPGYEILHRLGSGGMGDVHAARQLDPDRRVAIKVLRPDGTWDEPTRMLFEREIALQGGLWNEHIVFVRHAGRTEGGERFYVMDLVEGEAIDTYVRVRQPSREELLGLFATVCDAVGFAHQNGVLHLDLKPSNVLVTADGSPRILDFGFARQESAEDPGELRRGTPCYVSPEQAQHGEQRIDARSDIYSLGVVLYELLTGELPYPAAPADLDAVRAAIAAPRERRLPRGRRYSVQRDLWYVVEKCLAPDPTDRYSSASTVAEDLRCLLRQEPVTARTQTVDAVLFRAARKRWPAVLLVLVTFLLFGVKLSQVTWRAGLERHQNGQVIDSLSRMVDSTLRVVSPDFQDSKAVAIARESERIEIELTANQTGRLFLHRFLGMICRGIDDGSGAEREAELARQASLELFGPLAPETIQATVELARGYVYSGKRDEARVLLGQAMEQARALAELAPREAVRLMLTGSRLQTRLHRQQEAIETMRHAIEIASRSKEVDRFELGLAYVSLGRALGGAMRTEEAISNAQWGLELVRNSMPGDFGDLDEERRTAILEANAALAGLLKADKRMPQAIEVYQDNMSLLDAVYPPGHTSLALGRVNLAHALLSARRIDEACQLLESSLGELRRGRGPYSTEVFAVLVGLGDVSRARGEDGAAGALNWYEEALATWERRGDPGAPELQNLLATIGNLYRSLLRDQDPAGRIAESYFDRALAHVQAWGDPSGLRAAPIWNHLGTNHRIHGRYEEAEDCFQKALRLFQRVRPEATDGLRWTRNNLGDLAHARGEPHRAVVHFEDALERIAEDRVDRAETLTLLGRARIDLGHLDEAERCLWKARSIRGRELGEDDRFTAYTRLEIARLEMARGRNASAEAELESVRSILIGHFGVEHPRIREVDALLLEAKGEQGR